MEGLHLLRGVLYQMGIDANVMVLPFEKELSYPDTDALVRGGSAPAAPPARWTGRPPGPSCAATSPRGRTGAGAQT